MKYYFFFTTSFTYLIFLRVIGLSNHFFFDYDAVKNYSIAQEISSQNFNSLFHHGAPLMHLFHGLMFTILHLRIFYIPLIVESIGILIILQVLFNILKIKDYKIKIASVLIVGSSFVLVNAGRYFSLEPYSVFLFALWLRSYTLKNTQYANWWLLGLLILINYKMIILLPFCVVDDIFKIKKTRTYYLRYLIPLWIIPFSIALALLFNQNMLLYSKTIAAMYFNRSNTTVFNPSTFSFSLEFYSKYLLYFEHPILIVGILFSVYTIISKYRSTQKITILYTLPIYFLLILLFLPGAPRAIVLIIPFFCIAGILAYDLTLSKCKLNSTVSYSVLILSVVYPIFILYSNLYSKTGANYQYIATYVNQKNIPLLYTTSGIGIEPFLTNTNIKAMQTEVEYEKIPDDSYVLIDAEALLNGWKVLPKGKCVIESNNTCKTQIMLALENAEYSGFTFNQVIEASNKVINLKNTQLCLIKKGD